MPGRAEESVVWVSIWVDEAVDWVEPEDDDGDDETVVSVEPEEEKEEEEEGVPEYEVLCLVMIEVEGWLFFDEVSEDEPLVLADDDPEELAVDEAVDD